MRISTTDVKVFGMARTLRKPRLRAWGGFLAGAAAGAFLGVAFSAAAGLGPYSALPVEELRSFVEVYSKIKKDYVEQVKDKDLTTHAINGMLSGLDPHSAYLDPDAFAELQIGTQGEFGGLGIEVGMENGLVKVVSPIEDTPAWRSGIRSGDLIIKIDDAPIKGMSLQDAVKKMRGKPGSTVRLTIFREGAKDGKPFVVTLRREVIQVKSVKSERVEKDIGYMRLTHFQEHTAEELSRALTDLFGNNPNALTGLVLDLRNDPGGLLNAAVSVASVFLPENTLVVYTEGRSQEARMRLATTAENRDRLGGISARVKQIPLVVLINSGSASASEIVAGSLQDHGRAIVMGTPSFGKGSVQTVFPLGDGSGIKLTTARYYTPKGRSIQAKGIEPDILVDAATVKKDEEETMREADLQRHLSNPAQEEKKGDKPGSTLVSEEDYQLRQAVALLKGWNLISRQRIQMASQKKP